MPPAWRSTWLASLIFLGAAAVTGVSLAALLESAAPSATVSTHRILYLVPEGVERAHVPVPLDQFDDYGITVVHEFVDLKARTRPNTIGILIDRESLSEVHGANADDWVREQYAEGKTIGGMRIDPVELAAELGVGPADGAFFRYVPGRVFFAMASEQNRGGFRCRSATSDYLDRGMAENGLKRLVITIERNSRCSPGE